MDISTYLPPPMPWTSIFNPDAGLGVQFYNPGQDSTLSTEFLASFPDFSLYSGDVSSLKDEYNISDNQWALLCSGDNTTWEQTLDSASGTELLSSLGSVFSSVDAISELVSTLVSNKENISYLQQLGFYDAQLRCSVIIMSTMPTVLSSAEISGLQDAYAQMLDSPDLKDDISQLDGLLGASFDEEKAKELLLKCKSIIEDSFGISIEDVDPDFAAALSGEDLDADTLSAVLDKIKSGYMLEKTIELINSKSATIENSKETVAEIATTLGNKSMVAPITTVGVNLSGSSMANIQETNYEIAKDQAEQLERAKKKAEAKHLSKKHAEMKKAESESIAKHANQTKSKGGVKK